MDDKTPEYIHKVIDHAYSQLSRGPSEWTQRAYGRDINGFTTALGDPSTVCRCLGGQLIDSCFELVRKGDIPGHCQYPRFYDQCAEAVVPYIAMNVLEQRNSVRHAWTIVTQFNDRATYHEVINVLYDARYGTALALRKPTR